MFLFDSRTFSSAAKASKQSDATLTGKKEGEKKRNLVSGPARQNKSQSGCLATDVSLSPAPSNRCWWRMFFNSHDRKSQVATTQVGSRWSAQSSECLHIYGDKELVLMSTKPTRCILSMLLNCMISKLPFTSVSCLKINF